MRIPRGSTKPDWEVELGIVIGRRTSYLDSVEEARGVIAGYLVVNDVSERAFQIERGGQWVKGKSAETFNPDRELGVAAAARGRAAMSARSMRAYVLTAWPGPKIHVDPLLT